MNITDIEEVNLSSILVNTGGNGLQVVDPVLMWSAIYEKQKALLEKYAGIEEANGYPHPKSNHIDNSKFQQLLKDLMWRVHEELCEAAECVYKVNGEGNDVAMNEVHPERPTPFVKRQNVLHFLEEVSDALHFFIELEIQIGRSIELEDSTAFIQRLANPVGYLGKYSEVPQPGVLRKIHRVSYYLGMIGNTLKNKPWKTTNVETNMVAFLDHLLSAEAAMLELLSVFGDLKWVYIFYVKKNVVNMFRQGSNY